MGARPPANQLLDPRTPNPEPLLSGFGDEIADDLDEQLELLLSLDIRQLDLRGAWGRNVLALSDDEVRQLGAAVAERGVRVACVASPVGKAPVDGDFRQQLTALDRALQIARMLDARHVRVFSWYIPESDDPARHRRTVLRRLAALTRMAEDAGVVLLHENETGIYGDTPARCHDLLGTLDSPHLRCVWDPANFLFSGVARPFDASYDLLRPWIDVVHVKDAVAATGRVVVAGAGDAQWRESLAALRDSGFGGTYAFEPHLQVAGRAGGFTGPALYREAVAAFRGLLQDVGIAAG
jgi:sugar phosphate isomerase/epimerase